MNSNRTSPSTLSKDRDLQAINCEKTKSKRKEAPVQMLVTWSGSPPKAAMLRLTHKRANRWSLIAKLPSRVSVARNPRAPSR